MVIIKKITERISFRYLFFDAIGKSCVKTQFMARANSYFDELTASRHELKPWLHDLKACAFMN